MSGFLQRSAIDRRNDVFPLLLNVVWLMLSLFKLLNFGLIKTRNTSGAPMASVQNN